MVQCATVTREGIDGIQELQGTGIGSFFGDCLWQRIVPGVHSLRQLDRLIDWEVSSEKLVRLYRGQAEVGRPPHNPSVALEILLPAYPYGLSERGTEAFVNDSLPAKYFLGRAIDEPAPDHSTLTAFKRWMVQRGAEGLLEELLIEVV